MVYNPSSMVSGQLFMCINAKCEINMFLVLFCGWVQSLFIF